MKKISRRNFLKGAAVLGTAAAMTACGGSSSSTSTAASTSAAASTGAASAAEASGKLVIYSPNSDTQIDCTLTNGFMVKYPNIEVELQSMGTGDVLARQVQDLRSQNAGGWALYRYGSLFGAGAPEQAAAECAALRTVTGKET